MIYGKIKSDQMENEWLDEDDDNVTHSIKSIVIKYICDIISQNGKNSIYSRTKTREISRDISCDKYDMSHRDRHRRKFGQITKCNSCQLNLASSLPHCVNNLVPILNRPSIRSNDNLINRCSETTETLINQDKIPNNQYLKTENPDDMQNEKSYNSIVRNKLNLRNTFATKLLRLFIFNNLLNLFSDTKSSWNHFSLYEMPWNIIRKLSKLIYLLLPIVILWNLLNHSNDSVIKLLNVFVKSAKTNKTHKKPTFNSKNKLMKFIFICALICPVSGADFEQKVEQSIAEIFHKVAYGSSTTKRSVTDNWTSAQSQSSSTLATPILTTFKYRDNNNDEWARVDSIEKHKAEDINKIKEHRHHNKNHHHQQNGSQTRHNLQHDIKTYPETRKPISLLESDPKVGVSTRSSYNLIRNFKPTPPMHRPVGFELPSYSPPSRAVYTPLLPPNLQNSFADKPVNKGGSMNDYLNRRSGTILSGRHPQNNPGGSSRNDEERRKYYSLLNNESTSGTKKKSLNTPTRNFSLEDKIGLDFIQPPPRLNQNNSGFEYDYSAKYDSSASRIFFGPGGHKDAIPDVLRKVTAPTPYEIYNAPKMPPFTKDLISSTTLTTPTTTTALPAPPPGDSQRNAENNQSDDNEDDNDDLGEEDSKDTNNDHFVKKVTVTTSIKRESDEYNTTPNNIDENIQNLANVVNQDNVLRVYSTKTTNTFLNHTNRDNLYTWSVCWNMHIYLTVILYTILCVCCTYKLLRFDKLTHLFSQGYFIIVHLLIITICVARIFYLVFDPYNINLSFHKFISDIFLNLPLSLLAIAFATLYCHLLKRTLNSHFKVKPIIVIIGSFLHIFLCITLHLIENFDSSMMYSNNMFSMICQFIYILICLLLGVSYLYLYKMIRKMLAKKSQNFSELSVQNLSYATHITIAIALLFILMSILQIYGVFGLRNPERFSNIPPFKWLAWGFQFSIRLIEISILALLCWVVSIKLSLREKNHMSDTSNLHHHHHHTTGSSLGGTTQRSFTAGGFALFPCAATSSNSTVDNEIYPAVCQSNQNVHNYTLRSGKNLYEDDNYPLNNMSSSEGSGLPPSDIVPSRPNLGIPLSTTVQPSLKYNQEHYNSSTTAGNFDRLNYERSSTSGGPRSVTPIQQHSLLDRSNYERSSTLRSAQHYPLPLIPGTNSSVRATSNQAINCFENRYMDDNLLDNSDDHYENPDFELDGQFRRSSRRYNDETSSINSRSKPAPNIYGNNLENHLQQHDPNNSIYNEPIEQQSPHSSASEQYNFHNASPTHEQHYNFQSYERPNFDCHSSSSRPTSRTNSSSNYSSSRLTRGGDAAKRCSGNSSGSSGNSGMGTFERGQRMRKSGTLNDFNNGSERSSGGAKHLNSGTISGYHRNGVQTLNNVQKVHTYGKTNQFLMDADDSNDSMLVDENGFVRFRNLGSDFRSSGKSSQYEHHTRSSTSRRSGNKSREHKPKHLFMS